ncbi:MAG TPA: hypothetical protein VGO98_00735 [Candidatus Saccharimonadales bacterium]|jgi:hypothetical protein|nr:hypothetical protein [Candidatus Saccharimonadales bacterium]
MSEFSLDKYAKTPPPLGRRPDFEKLDQASAIYDSRLEHLPLDNFPELISSVDIIIKNLNKIRTRVDAPEIPNNPSVVRLMDHDQWKNLSGNSDVSNSLAHYDPLSGNIYQLFDEERYVSSRMDQIFTAYTVAHELSHKATHGLEKYSLHLSEGLADFLAQQTIEDGALEPFIDKSELDYYRHMYLDAGPLLIDGYELKAKDIFIVPNEDGSCLTRIPQLRLIEAIQTKIRPEHFDTFLRGAFTNNTNLVKDVLTKQFGEELACSFDDISGHADPRDLAIRILQTPIS